MRVSVTRTSVQKCLGTYTQGSPRTSDLLPCTTSGAALISMLLKQALVRLSLQRRCTCLKPVTASDRTDLSSVNSIEESDYELLFDRP